MYRLVVLALFLLVLVPSASAHEVTLTSRGNSYK